DFSVINGGYAVDAGYYPQEDALFLEPNSESAQQYINVIAARTDEANNETFKQIVEIYQTEETATLIDEVYHGGHVPAWDDYGFAPVELYLTYLQLYRNIRQFVNVIKKRAT